MEREIEFPQPLQSYVHVCRCQQSEDLLYATATGSYCSDLESRHDSRLLLRQLMNVSVSQKFIAFFAKYPIDFIAQWATSST